MKPEFSLRTYLICYIALIFLLVLTVFMSNLHLGKLDIVIALLIAVTKSLIILSYFMHAKTSKNYGFVIGGFCLFFLGVLFLVFSDFGMRIGPG